MKLSHENYDQLTVFTLKGDLTSDQVEAFKKSVHDRMRENIRDFVLDVQEMEFIDSQGLEAMIWLQERTGEQLGQIRLSRVSPNVEKILEITRLSARFDRHPDVDSAIKSLR